MANSCINISPEQIEFLKDELNISETDIRAIVNAMGELKSVEEIKDYLNGLESEDKDITFEKSSEDFKIYQLGIEITRLETIKQLVTVKTTGTHAQIQILDKLIESHREQQRLLKNNKNETDPTKKVQYSSVSKLKGHSPFKGDPTIYADFKDFGSFMHYVVEDILGLPSYENYNDRFTEEYFNNLLSSYKSKKGITLIESISDKDMYKMAKEIINDFNSYLGRGYILVPEITILGNVGEVDSFTKVNARIDVLAISPEGKLAIIDLKTKRVKNTTTVVDNTVIVNETKVLASLADAYELDRDDTNAFESFRPIKRSVYDDWFVQLEMYNNILKQNGFETSPEHSIFALIYDVTDDRQFTGSMFTSFTNHNYYSRMLAKYTPETVDRISLISTKQATEKFEALMRAVEEAIPTGNGAIKERVKKNIADSYDLKPTELQMTKLMDYVEKSLTAQMESLQKDLSTLDKDSSIGKLKINQYKTLKTIQKIILDKKDTDQELDVYRGIIYANALQAITSEIGDLSIQLQGNVLSFEEEAKNGIIIPAGDKYLFKDGVWTKNDIEVSLEEVMIDFPKVTKGLVNKHLELLAENKNEEAIRVYQNILQIYNQNKTYGELLQIMSNIANEVKNNNKEVTEDSPILKNMYKALSDYSYVNNLFKNASVPMLVNVLKNVDEKSFTEVKGELNQVLALRLQAIDKEIKDVTDGKYGNIKALSQKIYSFFSKSDKARLEELKNEANPNIAYYIEKLQKERDKIIAVMFDFQRDDASLTKYVEAMSDPNSPLYMGARDLFQPAGFLSTLNPNHFQASITDQDLGIASIMIVLKNSEALANMEIVNDVALQQLDRDLKELTKNNKVEDINKMISQKRDVIYYDRATGLKKETKSELFYVKPYTVEYENDFREFQALTAFHKQEVRKAKDNYFQSQKTKDASIIRTAKEEYDKAVQARDLNSKNQIQWMLQYCNLPFIDAWYQKQIGLPEKYKEQINDVYLEMYNINRQDPSLMSEEDYDQLLTLKAEIKKIKQQARDENPEYAAIIESMQDMYNAEIDYTRFEAFKKQAELQLANFPEGLEKWKKTYTITRPNKLWYQERAALYEELSAISTFNSDLSVLFERRRALLKPWTINGILNPQLIPTDVIEEIDGVENEIRGVLEDLNENPGPKPSYNVIQEIRRIKSKLNQLQRNELSPNYIKDRDSRKEKFELLVQEYNDAQNNYKNATEENQEELANQLTAARKNLENNAEEYVQWYNSRHKGRMTTDEILSSQRLGVLYTPKNFNYQLMPIDDRYMDKEVPNPDYFTTFNLKPEAHNPNFIESADKIPMPKGIMTTGKDTYALQPGAPVSKYIDLQFIAVKSDAKLSAYYDTLTSYYFSLQNKMEGVKTGYKVPGFASSAVEDIYYNDLPTAVKKRFKQIEDRMFKLRGDIDATENTYGDIDGIRGRFTRQLGADIQTKDAIGALYKFATEAHYNKAMQIAKPQVEGFIEYVKSIKTQLDNTRDTDPNTQRELEKRSREYANMLSILEAEKDKFIKGQLDNPRDREIKKVLNNMFMYVSMIRIGFDMTNQVKNYTSGSIQFWIAAGKAGKHYNDKDAITAYRKIFGSGGFMQHYLQDWGKISDIHESTMLYRIMNPLQKDMIKYVDEITGGKKRRLLNSAVNPMELGYMIQDKGDTMIGLMTMYSVMNSYKYKMIDPVTQQVILDDKGNEILVPAHECYYKDKDGTLKIREDVDYNVQDQLKLKRIIIAEMRRAQGNYASSDQTRQEREIMGKLMFFFRKFLVPLMLNRFGYLKPSWETGEASLGYWRATAQAFKHFGAKQTLTEFFLGFAPEDSVGKLGLKGVGRSIEINDPRSNRTMTVESKSLYVRKIAQARRDSIAMLAMSLLSSLLLLRLKGKDDDEISAVEGNMARLIWLTKMEVLSMFPFAGQSSQEYVKNFSTVIPFTKEATAAIKVPGHIMKALLVEIMQMTDSDEGDFYEEMYKDAFYARKSGAYEKGTSKLTKDLVDFSGIKNLRDIFQPENRLSQLKGKQ